MKINAVVVTLLSAVATAPVFAADSIPGLSTDSIVAQLGSVGTMVGAVGMGALAVVLGIKTVGYLKSALGR